MSTKQPQFTPTDSEKPEPPPPPPPKKVTLVSEVNVTIDKESLAVMDRLSEALEAMVAITDPAEDTQAE